MQKRIKISIMVAALAVAPLLAAPLPSLAQYDAKPAPAPGASVTKDSTGGGLITFEAVLVDAPAKALKKSAAVDVKVAAVTLIDADATDGKPKAGQAHIHHQLDKGPIIATTATKLAFHGLTPGPHTIVVTLAGNDHVPVGRENTLTVTIPQ
jgi:hypothetical protein